MKFSKKTATIAAFILGAAILTTSAFADIMLGSGYNSLKDSAKTTTAKLAKEADSFTLDVIVSAKVDGMTFSEEIGNMKYDNLNQAKETNSTSLRNGKVLEYYEYRDSKQAIYKNSKDDSYQVIERTRQDDSKLVKNPFEEEQIKDAEKILDALVGSLQDVVQVEESAGKKMYMGNLSETQIPSLVNAVSSFAFKYGILDEWNADRLDVPYPKSNIHLVSASGKAIENEEGVIESGIFTAGMSAEDSNGIAHIYSLDFSIDLKDINDTVVKAPNLDGKEVVYSKEGFGFDSKYVGKYKNDIVKLEKNSFEKLGERFIEITSVVDGHIEGRYYEVYKEGYEPDMVRDFKFISSDEEFHYETLLSYTDDKGEVKKGVMHADGLQNIHVMFNIETHEDNGGYSITNYDDNFNSNFIRIFE